LISIRSLRISVFYSRVNFMC